MAMERRRPKPAAYHLMSIKEKSARALGQARDASVRCPDCDMAVLPVDLLAHMQERCGGQPEIGAGAKWVSWREALAMGVPGKTFARWVERGFVRFVGERQDRKYLLRDLALRIAQRNGFRRR